MTSSAGSATKPSPPQAIFKGLLKHMRPMQALVFMAVYDQFPERYLPDNDFYFCPSIRQMRKGLHIKDPVIYFLLTNLTEAGWLQRRKSKLNGMEYRICFDKLSPFIREPVDTATKT